MVDFNFDLDDFRGEVGGRDLSSSSLSLLLLSSPDELETEEERVGVGIRLPGVCHASFRQFFLKFFKVFAEMN